MTKMEKYMNFMRYGKILKCEDFVFEDDNLYITMKVAELDDKRMLFIIRNRQLISVEDLRSGEKW